MTELNDSEKAFVASVTYKQLTENLFTIFSNLDKSKKNFDGLPRPMDIPDVRIYMAALTHGCTEMLAFLRDKGALKAEVMADLFNDASDMIVKAKAENHE